MHRHTTIKILCAAFFVLTLAALLMPSASAASSSTIKNSSIKWQDTESRLKLLSVVPVWQEADLRDMFNRYRRPQDYKLPEANDLAHFNEQFIHAFWGPLNNPFVKTARPVKAFLFFSKTYLMVPLVKNAADGNYYVFDNLHSKPLLLDEWFSNAVAQHAGEVPRFNICAGYGSKPDEVCTTVDYHQEIKDVTGSRNYFNARNERSLSASAHREPGQDWTSVSPLMNMRARDTGSIYGDSISWAKNQETTRLLNTVVTWPDYKTILSNFQKIRDLRYFDDETARGFARRISWMYPDDGCWTRASAMIEDFFGPLHNTSNQYPRPSKIFVFGNLCVNTDNSHNGSVSWWYHTAPVVKDAQTNQVYVLDPAVDSRKPLTLEQWTSLISASSGACRGNNSVNKFNICNGYGSMPNSRCESSYVSELGEVSSQVNYQRYERDRQKSLGRNVDAVLGESPPWLNS